MTRMEIADRIFSMQFSVILLFLALSVAISHNSPLLAQNPCSIISGYVEYDGEPLPYIAVVLNGADGIMRGSAQTSASGHYNIQVNNPPTRYRLLFIADNDAAKVHPTLDVSPRFFRTELFDYPDPNNCDRGHEDILIDFADPADPRDGVGLWLAGQVYQIREWFISAVQPLGPLTPDPVNIKVPVQYPIAGLDLPGHYWGVGNGIHIDENNIRAIYHEYGHFLSDRYASWIDIPDYGPPCSNLEHFLTCAMDCTVWPFLEGFAHLVGALSWIDIYGSLDATSPIAGNGPSWWIEDPNLIINRNGTCADNVNTWSCPGEDMVNSPEWTESTVGAALYDLVDLEGPSTSLIDPNEPEEYGEFTFADVFEVMMYDPDGPNYYNPCDVLQSRPNPIMLLYFWEAWREIHPGPAPRFWSALAQNHMEDWDFNRPEIPPILVSASHEIGLWTNSIVVQVEYDQQDDVSGVWWYAVELDQNSSTNPSVFAKASGLQEAVLNDTPYTTRTLISEVAAPGTGWYLHSRAQDQSGKEAVDTEHYGPLYIDLDPPVQQVNQPADQQTFLESNTVTIEFEAEDPGPDFSGIGKVIITYQDNAPGGVIVTIYEHDYSQPGTPPVLIQGPDQVTETIYWDIPDTVPATTQGGTIRVEVFDVAGNCGAGEADRTIHIINLFGPDPMYVASVKSGDVACADFDKDGDDDLAFVGLDIQSGAQTSQILSSTGSTFNFHTSLAPLEQGAVAWGDIDRDGLIDLVTTGLGPSNATETHVYLQISPGVFTDVGPLNIEGIMNGDLDLGDLDHDGDLDAVVIGDYKAGVGGTTPHRKVYHFDDQSGVFTGADLPWGEGNSSQAEVEIVDYNGDTWLDISIAGQEKTEILVGPGFSPYPNNPFFAVSSGSARLDWGDRDGNGVPAVAIMARSSGVAMSTAVWFQDGNSFTSGLNGWWTAEIERGDVLWGDVDNDGDTDLLVIGSDPNVDYKTFLMVNRGNTLMDILEIPEVISKREPTLAWCDYDGNANGGYDMDLVVMSEEGIECYINQAASVIPNTPPEPPTALNVQRNGLGNYTFSWDPPGTYDATPTASLTYDLQAGSTFGAADLFSGAYAVDHGNVYWNTQITLNLSNPGIDLYWSVRAVDGGFKRSDLAEGSSSPHWSFTVEFAVIGQAMLDAVNVSTVIIGIDPNAYAIEGPPDPPGYTVVMKVSDQYSEVIRRPGPAREEWKLNIMVGGKADPNKPGFFPVLSWDTNDLCPPDPKYGFFRLYLEDAQNKRTLVVPDMCQTNQYQIKEEDGQCVFSVNRCVFTYYIVWSREISVEMSFPMGWSLISLPVAPFSAKVSDLFPKAVVVYGYDRRLGYVRIKQDDDLLFGDGYWILFNKAQNHTLIGRTINKYTRTVYDDGWDMIGGCTFPARALAEKCTIGVIYGYNQEVGYQSVLESEKLKPEKGYWILLKDVFDRGKLIVNTSRF